jgi:hypothetical protein
MHNFLMLNLVVRKETARLLKVRVSSVDGVTPIWITVIRRKSHNIAIWHLSNSLRNFVMCLQFQFFVWGYSPTLFLSDTRDLSLPWDFPYYIFNGDIWILFLILLFECIAVVTSLYLRVF